MDFVKREQFWKTLCSLPGKDVKLESQELMQAIKYPNRLFRYRPVSLSSLEALRTNKLYFSSANYYDDPFDTFLHIDIEKIKSEYISIFSNQENINKFVASAREVASCFFTEKQMEQLNIDNLAKLSSKNVLEEILNSVLKFREEVKKEAWSVCFSEDGFNETLWLKYAEQYKGFVQIYDLNNDENFLCGKQEKCINCGIIKYGTPLYPVYYSDIPYDATNFAKFIMMNKICEVTGMKIPEKISSLVGNGLWERERTTLIKKECHKYDREWRMITGCVMNPPVMMEWIPSGIILGLRMGKAEENLVVSMAKEAGVQNIYKSFINSRNLLDAYPIMIKER